MSKVMPLTIYSPIFSGVEHCAHFYVNLCVIWSHNLLDKTAMTLICKKCNRLDTKVASELTIYSPKFGGVEHCALLHIIVMHIGPIISM